MTWRNRVFLGSCESMAEIPSASVHCCVTSPPYWGLRSYGQNAGMIGLEDSVDEYVARLVGVFREVRRVLRDDGTLWLNLGDAYAGSWGAQSRGNTKTESTTLEGAYISGPQIAAHPKESMTGSIKRTPGLKPKDLIGLPWMVAFALRADGWWLRQDIIWAKPNPMPSSVTDRPTSAHEYLFLLSKSKHYYYDRDAIREPLAESSVSRLSQANIESQRGSDRANAGGKTNGPMKAVASGLRFGGGKGVGDAQGSGERLRNGQEWRPRTVDGSVPPANRPSRHGDDIPRAKTRPGTPDNPDANEGIDDRWAWANREYVGANKRDVWTVATVGYKGAHFAVYPPDLIRPCILAGSPPGGVVLDPFMGSGTTARVSLEHGRDFVGYEINPEYHALIADRLGLFGESA